MAITQPTNIQLLHYEQELKENVFWEYLRENIY